MTWRDKLQLRISRPTKDRIIEVYGGKCHYCGQPACEIDHIHPKSLGGSDDLDNLVPSCTPCNRKKGARPLPFFKRWKAKRTARKMRPQIERDTGRRAGKWFGIACLAILSLMMIVFS